MAEPRFEVTSFGETMLRLSVPVGERLEAAQSLEVHVGGAESNVCAALASLGRRCGWLSRLPDNPLGRAVLRRLRAAGMDTSAVLLVEGARLGTYYAEFAAAPRPTEVLYDRAHAAIAGLSPADVDWSYLLDTRLLHLTGITPALGEGCHRTVQDALARAHGTGVAVSLDVNYRRKLWPPGEAARTLGSLIAEVDLLICGETDAEILFGLEGDEGEILAELQALTRAQHVILTLGARGAAALSEGQLLRQPAVPAQVVDRFGAGDAFAAGVLDGWLDGSVREGLRRGASLAALAVTQRGDMVLTDRAEMNRALDAATDRIVR